MLLFWVFGKGAYQLGEEKGRSQRTYGVSRTEGRVKEREAQFSFMLSMAFFGSSPVVLHISHFKD